MTKSIFLGISINTLLFANFVCFKADAQMTAEVKQLENKINQFNNQARNFDSSIVVLQKFMDRPTATNLDKYFANLFMSYTYKSLHDYKSVFIYLDDALYWGSQSDYAAYCKANVMCQQAFAYFDILKYDSSALLMGQLAKTGYKHISVDEVCMVEMQQGYLHYLNKKYDSSLVLYRQAIELMKQNAPCYLPLVYGKMISLYGRIGDKPKMWATYDLSKKVADSCKIIKYNMYTEEMLRNALHEQKDFAMAYKSYDRLDSMKILLNESAQLQHIATLEAKNEVLKKEVENIEKGKVIQKRNTFIFLLFSSILALCLAFILNNQRLRKKQMKSDRELTDKYTQHLLQQMEKDRARIAGTLHDNINHELLLLKNGLPKSDISTQEQITKLINEVRGISRELHPIILSTVGLQKTIEQLCERMEQKYNFMISTDIQYHDQLTKDQEVHVYRIIQEALNNMVKHSRAIAGMVSIATFPNHTEVVIKDNGVGFVVDEMLMKPTSFGVLNIIERAKAIGGEANFKSDHTGTQITISIQRNISL